VSSIFERFASQAIPLFMAGVVRALDDHGDFGETRRRVG
jgi:hypothetical protein